METIYICNSEKNTECKKTYCYWLGRGECRKTFKPECSADTLFMSGARSNGKQKLLEELVNETRRPDEKV